MVRRRNALGETPAGPTNENINIRDVGEETVDMHGPALDLLAIADLALYQEYLTDCIQFEDCHKFFIFCLKQEAVIR